MAKKKPAVTTTDQDRHTTPRVVFHVPADLLEAIDGQASKHYRTRTAELIRIIRTLYKMEGIFPPAAK